MWAHPCAHVIFDTDPTPRGRGGPAEEEEMSQALIRSVVTALSSQNLLRLCSPLVLTEYRSTSLSHLSGHAN